MWKCLRYLVSEEQCCYLSGGPILEKMPTHGFDLDLFHISPATDISMPLLQSYLHIIYINFSLGFLWLLHIVPLCIIVKLKQLKACIASRHGLISIVNLLIQLTQLF